jgi:iron complex outermembrane receptor protein
MKSKRWLALLPAVCLCWAANSMASRPGPGGAGTCAAVPAESAAGAGADTGSETTGRIVGVLRDPTGAVVPGAKIDVKNAATGAEQSRETNPEGRFIFPGLAPGVYQVTIIISGFEMVIVRDVTVTAGHDTVVNVTLRIPPLKTEVEVQAAQSETASAWRRTVNAEEQASSRNAAEMAAAAPGASLRESGALAGVPLLHGLGDERAKVVVDGATVSSACPNHMNPPLSFMAPAQAARVTVMAGITPMSLGGDSLGGTVEVESEPPVFAGGGERLHEQGAASGFYRSNGQYYGGALSEWVGGRNLTVGYTGSWSTNDDFADGYGHKATSTYAQSTDHSVTLAAEGAGNLLVLRAGVHHTPYEGFRNAQMDLVRNYAEQLNLHYRRTFERGAADGRAYWQNDWHAMNIGRDKSTFPMAMAMPMNTHGRDLGYSAELELPLGARQTLRTGNEMHRFRLDDRWPAVAGSAPMMGPNAFVSINDGTRTRLGSYVEAASRWNARWTTLEGLRNDTVWMNAGPVEGYCSAPYMGMDCPYSADATAFNAASRAHTNPEIDATALARWEPKAGSTYEFGYARKNRAPNLYERYAWSTSWMPSGMIGWFGDGNYYVGNVGLKPETAQTVSGTANWRGGAEHAWEIKATPYLTEIQNFVDVDTLATATYGLSTFAQLKFANHNARIYGGDLAGKSALWKSARLGQGRISGVAAWLHGERLDTETPLYQMMPSNARVNLDEEMKGFAGGVQVEAVDRKSNVDPQRFEQQTPGYALVNLHAEYRRGYLNMSAACDNVLNKGYELPLGGVNMDDFMASGWTSRIRPVTGRGRTGSFSLSARF